MSAWVPPRFCTVEMMVMPSFPHYPSSDLGENTFPQVKPRHCSFGEPRVPPPASTHCHVGTIFLRTQSPSHSSDQTEVLPHCLPSGEQLGEARTSLAGSREAGQAAWEWGSHGHSVPADHRQTQVATTVRAVILPSSTGLGPHSEAEMTRTAFFLKKRTI